MARHCPKAESLVFMSATSAEFDGIDCSVSRSGYTGEDGFEISVPSRDAETVARTLLAEPEVKPIGLGARDSLRLEAGLAALRARPRRDDVAGRGGSRLRHRQGAAVERRLSRAPSASCRSSRDGPSRKRVGIRPSGRAPVRDGAKILAPDGREIGIVTSGGFGPTVNAPVAMGYVETRFSAPGTEVLTSGRRDNEPATIAAMPFVPHRYVRSRSLNAGHDTLHDATTNGCSSTATSPRSASPPTPPSSSATSSSSSCRRSAAR